MDDLYAPDRGSPQPLPLHHAGVFLVVADQSNRARTRGIRNVLAAGVLLAAFVWAAGLFTGRVRLGVTDEATLARVEREVVARFNDYSSELRQLVAGLASPTDRLVSASTDARAAKALFDAAQTALGSRDGASLALTVYDANGSALAWGGRAAELPVERIEGPAALFVAPGPLGPRLVYVEPVQDNGRRLATLVAERVLAPIDQSTAILSEEFLLETSVVPVSLRTRYEGAGDVVDGTSFIIPSPTGETLLEARVSRNDFAAARRAWERNVTRWTLVVLAGTLLLLVGPMLDVRSRARTASAYTRAALAVCAALIVARWIFWIVVPRATSARPVFSPETYSSDLLSPLLASPIDLLCTALLAVALVTMFADALERLRRSRSRFQFRRGASNLTLTNVSRQVIVTAIVFGLIVGLERLLEDTLRNSSVDILHFSLHPWDSARLAINLGVMLSGAAIVWLSVLLLRYSAPVRLTSSLWQTMVRVGTLGGLLAIAVLGGLHVPAWPTLFTVVSCFVVALCAQRALARFRRATQGVRLIGRLMLLALPALFVYPALFHFAGEAKRRLIETDFAPQALRLGTELRQHLSQSLAQIDGVPQLADLVKVATDRTGNAVTTDAAFAVWSLTDLAQFRLTSAVEIYGPEGRLVSRFALNLPEETSLEHWRPPSCRWEMYGEVSPFGAEERRVLHAGRGLCSPGARRPDLGAIVVHTMPDFNALPVISSQGPYFDLVRTGGPSTAEGLPGRDLEFVAYGWSRMPLYTSAATAWTLDDRVFSTIASSRSPFWTTLQHSGVPYDVYFLNERAGIYAFGYPSVTLVGHLVNLAELVALAVLGGVVIALGAWLFGWLAGRQTTSGRALLREIRASFYRKLFIAFVLASVVPVLTLALLTRTYFAGQLRASIESEAVRTVAVARRVVEDYATQQERGSLTVVADDVLVWISRVIEQDVNIFEGSRLQATSVRDLYASGLVPTRTPASVYRAIALERLPSFVGDERVGATRYLLAAAPVRSGNRDGILTVPMTLRQQEIESEIDDLDRRVLLAALVFIFLGAVIGYSMAERIADPVNRLTRATRRVARGDLDARIAATSSDELSRLVDAFNTMAADLASQRGQLERTHRLEAWAEMARQVAHEIKNPLTPIQLSAEHLLRVHMDQGRPLAPVVEDCMATILAQVRLLRQIAGEFSSFASSPISRPAPHAVSELVADVVEPYRVGVRDRIAISIQIPAALPAVFVDRTLVGRALTNVIENALHAMPGRGSLTIGAELNPDRSLVLLAVSDTGVGMNDEDLAHIFEPYFSTRATGTGLGLTIARRNVELSGGQIDVESEKGRGTTVRLALPVATDR